jgi:starvation-inducible DNA-binding protein
MSDSNLAAKLRNLHADNFLVYFKVHTYHFNVQGKTFSQDHQLLNETYDTLWEFHDTIGEGIRQLGSFPYCSLTEMHDQGIINDIKNPQAKSMDMLTDVHKDLETLIKCAQTLYTNSGTKGGIQTMLGDYLKAISKLEWKFDATIEEKSDGV